MQSVQSIPSPKMLYIFFKLKIQKFLRIKIYIKASAAEANNFIITTCRSIPIEILMYNTFLKCSLYLMRVQQKKKKMFNNNARTPLISSLKSSSTPWAACIWFIRIASLYGINVVQYELIVNTLVFLYTYLQIKYYKYDLSVMFANNVTGCAALWLNSWLLLNFT